jgi:hypothetical protein
MKNIFPSVFIVALLISACNSPSLHPTTADAQGEDLYPDTGLSFMLHQWNATITAVMVGDGFSPVLASRTYAYPNIAAYEVLQLRDGHHPTPDTPWNELRALPTPDTTQNYSYELAAIQAFATVSKKLLYREDACDALLQQHIAFFRDSMQVSEEVIANSVNYGTAAGAHILEWAAGDRYAQTKANPKYIFSQAPGKWSPTPSDFRSALEPYWGTLRTFSGIKTEDNQVPFVIPFSEAKGSPFYNLVMEVYDKSQQVTDEERTIATYWDDSPDQMSFVGHVPSPKRSISPPAHWIAIAGEACKNERWKMSETAKCYTMVSVAIADAMICCWVQKYETNLIRPVTYIRKNIDEDWMPIIVNPPFPEHSSGHASVSFAAATILTHLVGDNHPFTDTRLVEYGLGERSFKSYNEAAQEAAISRFYGGIHYTTGMEGGKTQGIRTGEFVIGRLSAK